MASQQSKVSDVPSVNISTTMGKNYSVERYYMLSEIEQHSLRPVYLNDYFCPDNDAEMEGEDKTVATVTSETEDYECELPAFIILYLLWNCESTKSSAQNLSVEEEAESFRKGHVEKALRKLQSLSERIENSRRHHNQDTNPKIAKGKSLLSNVYVVVDALLWSGGDEDEGNNNNHQREKRFQEHLSVVEALTKKILSTSINDKNDVDENKSIGIRLCGATVGLADHARAAPGLESCLEAIMVGVRDRRRYGNTTSSNTGEYSKSNVGIVCHSLQDLVGYDEETETDAVQGVMQSLTHAAFDMKPAVVDETNSGRINASTTRSNRNESQFSPVLDYARKAHRYWRVEMAGLPPEPTPEEKKAYDDYSSDGKSNFWIIAIVALLAAFWWKKE